jgi:hypothetical protein
MNLISDQDLYHFNKLGLIPGPGESEEAFAKRAAFSLNLRSTLNAHLGQEIPFQPQEVAELAFFSKAKKETKERFGISPDWVPIFFSNHQLYPWHGGCAWIFQLKEDTPAAALLQLRKKLHSSPTLLGLYERDELITHELSHVGRLAFEEPKFEELLAYTTARSAFRRYFGPLFQSSKESFLFLIVLIGIAVLDACLLFSHPFAYWQAMWLKMIPLGMAGYAFFRLWKKQRTYRKCYRNLYELFPSKAGDILYRLTDREIDSFARWDLKQIQDYIKEQNSLRWRAIKLIHRASSSASYCRS